LAPLLWGFFIVHDKLAQSDYAPECWHLLSPELPSLGFWWDDRCEMLRRATRDWMMAHAQSPNPLLHAATNDDQRHLVIRMFNAVDTPPEPPFLD
jgi:hypothetical protein